MRLQRTMIYKNDYIKDNLALRDFQKEVISMFLKQNKGLIVLPTGTGKTITAFTLFSLYKGSQCDLKLIYITEKPLIEQTISQDLPNYFNLKFGYVYNHSKKERLSIYKSFTKSQDALIINYASLRIDFQEVGNILQATNKNIMVVLDEATAFKNETTQISKCVKMLCRAVNHSYAMTATPSATGLYNIYTILQHINCAPYKSKYEFEKNHCDFTLKKLFLVQCNGRKKLAFGMDVKEHRDFVVCHFSLKKSFKITGEIKILSRPVMGHFKVTSSTNGSFSWYIKKDLLTKVSLAILINGKKTTMQISVFNDVSNLTYKNIKQFKEITQKYMFIKSKKEIANELPAITLTYNTLNVDKETEHTIKQLYTNKVNVTANQVEIALITPQVYNETLKKGYINSKMQQLIDYLQNDIQDEKVLIYFPYTQAGDIIKNILEKELKTDVCYITGTSQDNNARIETFLQDDKQRIMLGTSTILKGLNLQKIDYIVALQLPYTFANYQQLAGRINRIGATSQKKVLNCILTKGQRDEAIFDVVMAQTKLTYEFNNKLVDEGLLIKNKAIKGLTEQEALKSLDNQLTSQRERYITNFVKSKK